MIIEVFEIGGALGCATHATFSGDCSTGMAMAAMLMAAAGFHSYSSPCGKTMFRNSVLVVGISVCFRPQV
jgi:hypothetical protein